MSASQKTAIIESLFNLRWQKATGTLSSNTVTLSDVQAAIVKYKRLHPGSKISAKNPANFFKDFIRRTDSANKNWPITVFKRGYTARQLTGKGFCFEFLELKPNQVEPFESSAILPGPLVQKHRIQSVSMPIASRRLGRNDEAWLVQVLVKLHIVETHLSLFAPLNILQVDLLQTNIKQSKTEIDAMFLAIEKEKSSNGEVIVTCEAKVGSDDILTDQIIAQVNAVFAMKSLNQSKVVPMGAKAIGPSSIYVAQFSPIYRGSVNKLTDLKVESEAVYELVPEVTGIGKN